VIEYAAASVSASAAPSPTSVRYDSDRGSQRRRWKVAGDDGLQQRHQHDGGEHRPAGRRQDALEGDQPEAEHDADHRRREIQRVDGGRADAERVDDAGDLLAVPSMPYSNSPGSPTKAKRAPRLTTNG
jgi:hypothetical protein